MWKESLLAAALTLTVIPLASAETFEVKMLNKGEMGGMVFEPAYVKAQPGDTVVFLPTDKGHNAESIKGMLPAGAESFKSAFNEEFSLTLESEGFYGVKCTPHYALGMIALIEVGTPQNAEEAQAVEHPGKAGKRFDAVFEKAGL